MIELEKELKFIITNSYYIVMVDRILKDHTKDGWVLKNKQIKYKNDNYILILNFKK